MGEADEFNTLTFEKRLAQLKDTQESIQGLSSWCLKQREHHKKIVASWLNVLKRVKIEQRLVLFYLANDVIQYSKRKNYEFVESWGLNLQKATPLVRDERVRHKILRIFKIWEQRSVYDDEFLSDLTGLLSAGAVKKTDDDPLDFQPQQLVNKIKQCTVLEADTDLRLKYIHESHLELSDADALCANLKDRSNKDDVEKELNEGIGCVERYTQALQREIVAREALLVLLTTANQYYSTQRGEVKVVAYAYKNFGARVRALKRKLDELAPSLPDSAPSPPQRDEDVPSPGPDEDLDLPLGDTAGDDDVSYNIDRTFNTSMGADGTLYNLGLSSFLTSDNPLALFNESDIGNSNKIEVINNRPSKEDFNINDFLKTLVPNDNNTASDNNSVTSATLSQKSQDTLPGLDLLSPESGVNQPPPRTSFYGSMDCMNDEPEPYHPENPQWNNNTWNIPVTPTTPTPVPPVSMPPISMPPISMPPISMPPLSMPSLGVPVPLSRPSLGVPAPLSRPSLGVPVPLSRPPLNRPPMGVPPVGVPIGVSLSAPAPGGGALRPGGPGQFRDTPESPPPAPPPPPAPVPIVPVYSHAAQDMPAADVDHRSSIIPPPPPPPPPILPMLGNIEDVDHRLLPSLPPPPLPATTTTGRHSGQQDVDHRNLISLTHMRPAPPMEMDRRSMNPPVLDQDYRVPPLVTPSDIVESVDMDLSEDEDQQRMFPNQDRRNNFNNNKVLVGGDNGKTGQNHGDQNHGDQNHTNLIQINRTPVERREPRETREPREPRELREPPSPLTPGTHQPLSNPFDNMPVGLKTFNMPFQKLPQNFMEFDEGPEENSNDSAYEEDLRSRGIDHPNPMMDVRNPSPPDYENTDSEWQNQNQNHMPPFNNQRFPRNWGPRTNFRPPFGPQFWPRNGPRPPNRWMGPRPQRFW